MCFSHKVCSFLLSNFKPGQVIYLKEKKEKKNIIPSSNGSLILKASSNLTLYVL